MNEIVIQEEVLLVVVKDLCGQFLYDVIGVDMFIDSFDYIKDKKYELMVQFLSVFICLVEDLKNMFVFVQEFKKWFNNSGEIFIKERENCKLYLFMEDMEEEVLMGVGFEERIVIFDDKGESSIQFECFFLLSF